MHLILLSFFLAFRWSLYFLQRLCCYRCRIYTPSFKVVDTQASSESFGNQLLIALAKSFLWPRIISKFAMSDSAYEHESLAGVEIFALRWFPLSLSLNNCCNTRFWSQMLSLLKSQRKTIEWTLMHLFLDPISNLPCFYPLTFPAVWPVGSGCCSFRSIPSFSATFCASLTTECLPA